MSCLHPLLQKCLVSSCIINTKSCFSFHKAISNASLHTQKPSICTKGILNHVNITCKTDALAKYQHLRNKDNVEKQKAKETY